MPVAYTPRPSAPPDRSLEQRRAAIKKAQRIRTQRAIFKRRAKGGQVDVTQTILDPPDFLLTAKVFDLLLSVPKWGRVRVNRALISARISPSKSVGGLTGRQREELASRVRSAR